MPKYKGVYPKGKKFYGAKWYQGKTYTTKLYDTAGEAAEALEELTKNLKGGLKYDKKNITVRDFVALYLKSYILPKKNLQKLTLKSIEIKLRNGIIPYIGDKKLQKLTPLDLQALQNKLLARYKINTARMTMNEFKRVLRRALIWNYISRDPSIGLDTIPESTDKPNILTLDHLSIIMQCAELRDKSAICLGYLAGLRISEIFGLQWNKVNFKEHTIRIDLQFCEGDLKPPKKGSIRTVPMLSDLEPILKEWKIRSRSLNWLFPGRGNKPMMPNHWTLYYFYPLLKDLELPRVKFHSLRHAFDKMMHDEGIPTRDIMQMMGHKTVKMSLHYDRESPERLIDVTRNIKLLEGDKIWKQREEK